jgi:hypothetical protein
MQQKPGTAKYIGRLYDGRIEKARDGGDSDPLTGNFAFSHIQRKVPRI